MKQKKLEPWRWLDAQDVCALALKSYYQAGRDMAQTEAEMGEPLGPEEGAMFALFLVESLIDRVGKLAASRDVACNHGCSLSSELWWPVTATRDAEDAGFYSRLEAKRLQALGGGVNNHGQH